MQQWNMEPTRRIVCSSRAKLVEGGEEVEVNYALTRLSKVNAIRKSQHVVID
jgi:hypothetical protein